MKENDLYEFKFKKLVITYKQRLFPTKRQIKILENECFVSNQVYNIILSILRNNYSIRKTIFTQEDFSINDLAYFPERFSASELDGRVLQILNKRKLKAALDTRQQVRNIAIKAFWDGMTGEKGYAHYKRFDFLNSSFGWVNARTKINRTHIQLTTKMGPIKMKLERNFPENSKLKSVRIKRENGNYYAILVLELEKKSINPKEFIDLSADRMIGMDSNQGHYDFSDGSVYNYNLRLSESDIDRQLNGKKTKRQKKLRKLKKEFTDIRKLEQKQSRRIEKAKKIKNKLGKNYHKDKIKLGKLKKKAKNRRHNDLHKASNEVLFKLLRDNLHILFIEDLKISEMTAKDKKTPEGMNKNNHKTMRKNVLNQSYAEFFSMLEYKAMQNDRLVISVDPKYTSQECSSCKKKNKMNLADRFYECKHCGLKIGRDYNSSINIKHRGRGIWLEFMNTLNLGTCAKKCLK